MKVLLRKNVPDLGRIGDVVEVKPGYARNYLLPQGIAYQPSQANVKTVEAEKHRYLAELAQQRSELEAEAAKLQGREVTISARANVQGHLYGSVGPAQIAAAMTAEGLFVTSENVVLDEPIRQLDKYDVTVRLAEGVTATVHVWIVPAQEAPGEGEEQTAAENVEDAPVEEDLDASAAPTGAPGEEHPPPPEAGSAESVEET